MIAFECLIVNSPTPPSKSPIIRRGEQLLLAVAVAAFLIAMIVAWRAQDGHRQGLIEIDRAAPVEIQYAVDINVATWRAQTSWNLA